MPATMIKYINLSIVGLCILAFLPILKAGFVNYDDPEYVLNNFYIKKFSIENILAIFQGKATILYVPLTVFTYLIEYTLFGENAFVFHAVNLFLHILNTLLLFKILVQLKITNHNLIYAILIFFCINPLVCESVCWITERKDMLYCCFCFLASLQFLNYTKGQRIKHIGLCFLFFVLACLSKPMAISLPCLFLIFLIYTTQKFELKKALFLLPFFLVSLIFSVISVYSIKNGAGDLRFNYSLLERVTLLFSEIGYYFFKPFFPINQQLINLFPRKNAVFSDNTLVLFACLAIIILTSTIYIAIKNKNRLILYLFIAWFIFLLPILQLYPNTHSYVSERYFYVSIIFPVTILFIYGGYFKIKEQAVKASLIGFMFVFVFLTFKRTKVWANSKTLFEQELKIDENDTYALNNLGYYYNSKSDFVMGNKLLFKSVTLDPHNPLSLNNYAWSLAGLGKTDSAIVYFNKALYKKKNFIEAFNNLGICYVKKEDDAKAYLYFKKAYTLDSNNNESIYNLGAYYLKIGLRDKARPLIKRAHQLGNKSAVKYLNY